MSEHVKVDWMHMQPPSGHGKGLEEDLPVKSEWILSGAPYSHWNMLKPSIPDCSTLRPIYAVLLSYHTPTVFFFFLDDFFILFLLTLISLSLFLSIHYQRITFCEKLGCVVSLKYVGLDKSIC